MIQSRRQKYGFLAFCIVPALLLFLIVTIYPLGYGLYMSFFKWSGASSNREFIGLANYARLFSDKLIPVSIYNDYFLVVVKMVFIMLLALLFAVALTQMRIREAAVYRFVFFFPTLCRWPLWPFYGCSFSAPRWGCSTAYWMVSVWTHGRVPGLALEKPHCLPCLHR